MSGSCVFRWEKVKRTRLGLIPAQPSFTWLRSRSWASIELTQSQNSLTISGLAYPAASSCSMSDSAACVSIALRFSSICSLVMPDSCVFR